MTDSEYLRSLSKQLHQTFTSNHIGASSGYKRLNEIADKLDMEIDWDKEQSDLEFILRLMGKYKVSQVAPELLDAIIGHFKHRLSQ